MTVPDVLTAVASGKNWFSASFDHGFIGVFQRTETWRTKNPAVRRLTAHRCGRATRL